MLTFVIDGSSLRREVKKAGTVHIPWPGPARRVRVVAWDAAGNVSGPVVRAPRSSDSGESGASRLAAWRPLPPFGKDVIESILPHRDPFLLVDEVTELEPDRASSLAAP